MATSLPPLRALRQALHLPPDAPVLRPALWIGAAALAVLGAYGAAAGWFSPQRLSPRRIINTFNANFGEHPGYRRNHAKGVCVLGYFEGNGSASSLSTAAVFGTTRTPVVGRFAVPGGNPGIADGSVPVRSMALQFSSPGGEQWRMGMNNAALFTVNTPQAFYQQLIATRPDPATGKPDPARVKAFYAAHPESAAALAWGKSHPPSTGLGNGTYYSINAFELIDAHGEKHAVRWAMQPEQPYAALGKPAPTDPDFLSHDLQQQLQQGPLRWHLILTLAAPGDPTNDATRAWPADRPTVDAGTLTLQNSAPQADGPCRDINFDPTILPHGVALSDDPLLAARQGAYSRSFNLRTHEEAAAQTPAARKVNP
ncbi:catalase family peroxidase [Amantichitinum ursilacus]|nr:catalase family peroxidase [Amantichitinum ursilacus]